MEDALEVTSVKVKEIENAIKYWNEVLQKSEKYERLMEDIDFKDVLQDIQASVDAHDNEIKSCLDNMSQYTPKIEADAWHTIRVHQILKEQAQQAMRRPKEIVELAKKARMELPELQEQLTQLKAELSHG